MENPMSKLVRIILVASLALNTAFIVSYFFGGKSNPEEENLEEYRMDLNLQDKQQKEIEAIIKTFRINLLRFKQEILSKRMEIIEELGDPEFDPENLKAKTNELNELENQINLGFINTLIEINGALSTRQRIDFLLKLSQNWFFVKNGGSDPI